MIRPSTATVRLNFVGTGTVVHTGTISGVQTLGDTTPTTPPMPNIALSFSNGARAGPSDPCHCRHR